MNESRAVPTDWSYPCAPITPLTSTAPVAPASANSSRAGAGNSPMRPRSPAARKAHDALRPHHTRTPLPPRRRGRASVEQKFAARSPVPPSAESNTPPAAPRCEADLEKWRMRSTPRRHDRSAPLPSKELGISWDPVHEEADVLEHLPLGRRLARGMRITLVEERVNDWKPIPAVEGCRRQIRAQFGLSDDVATAGPRTGRGAGSPAG